jgi:hypothetical protein
MADGAPRVPKRIAGWKLVGLIAAVLGVFALTYAGYIHSVAERRWQAMEKSIQELHALSSARNGPRSVLRGTAVPGYAWDDYSPGLTTMKGAPTSVLGEFVGRGAKADRAQVEAAVAAHASALEALRKGAMRTDGNFRSKWEQGFSMDVPGLFQVQNMANLAVCKSRLLADEGRHREAAELMLDTCQFAHDIGYNQILIPEMISIAIYGLALEELRDLILRGKLSKEDFREIARELEILAGSFPRNGHSMMNEAMAMGYECLKSNGDFDLSTVQVNRSFDWTYTLWRTVFPGRLVCADAYFTELDYMKQFAAADEQSWGACQAVGSITDAEIRKLRNPIARLAMPGLFSSNRAGRERRTHLQLLRAAAHHRATGTLPDLEDPFGAKLLSSEQGGKVKVWSMGWDRVDDGGKGEWKPRAGPDIVLEFDK